MKIGIIDAGRVGTTLGRKWKETNHEVFFGIRKPDMLWIKLAYTTPLGRDFAFGLLHRE